MLHSSHEDGWMDCLFCCLSRTQLSLLDREWLRDVVAVTAGGVWCSGYALANYILSPPRAGLSFPSRGIRLCPMRTACWGLEQWLQIISNDKKHPTCQILSLVSSSYFLASNATLCLNLFLLKYSVWEVARTPLQRALVKWKLTTTDREANAFTACKISCNVATCFVATETESI